VPAVRQKFHLSSCADFRDRLYLAAGTTGRKLVDAGRASFRRWNVHPTFSQNLRLIERIDPRRVMPAFGDSRFFPLWRARLAPREVITSATTVL